MDVIEVLDPEPPPPRAGTSKRRGSKGGKKPTKESEVTTKKEINTRWFHIVFFFFFGVSSLLAWNSFCTNIPHFESVSLNKSANLRSVFASSMSLLTMVALILSNLLNILILYRFRSSIRVFLSLFISLAGFIIITAALCLHARDWVIFLIVMLLAAVLNTFSPILTGAFFVDLSFFNKHCLFAFNIGQAFAGLFVALIQALLKLAKLGDTKESVLFFLMVQLTMLYSTIFYVFVTQSFAYSRLILDKLTTKVADSRGILKHLLDIMKMFLTKWLTALGLFFSMAITFFVFPTLLTRINTVVEVSHKRYSDLFVILNSFLIFNAGDVVGRTVNLVFQWPKANTCHYLIFCLLRVFFIPIFVMCNQTSWPKAIVMRHDAFPIIFTTLFGLTNGHAINIAMCEPFTLDTVQMQNDCSSLYVLMIGCGMVTGAIFSFII